MTNIYIYKMKKMDERNKFMIYGICLLGLSYPLRRGYKKEIR